jgi:hypothetical protein
MRKGHWSHWAKRWWVALSLLLALGISAPAGAQSEPPLTVTVLDDAGNPVKNGFRWLLEEDNTYGIKKTDRNGPWTGQAVSGAPWLPGTPSPNADWNPLSNNPTHTLGVNVHRSHARTICVGDTRPANADATAPADPAQWPNGFYQAIISTANCPGYTPAKNYMLSVLPWHTSAPGAALITGYGMSGRNVAHDQKSVTVVVHPFPQATAQITVRVFEDNQPINGAFDQPAEHGLGEFSLILSDMAGQVLQDAFSNPLGTTYYYKYTTSDGRPADAHGNALLQGQQPEFLTDDSGLPIPDWTGDGTITTCPGPRGTSGIDGYTPYQLANCIDPYTLTPLDVGEAVIRYIPMNKYAVEPVPPAKGKDCGTKTPPGNPASTPPDCSDMLLTATLEGTRQNDAWVRATEPRFNINLGQLNALVFYGFVHPMNALATPSSNTGSLSGQVVQAHDQHPPRSPGLSPGLPVPDAFVGLSNLSGNDQQVYTAAANPDNGQFTIDGIPPGTYQLAVWDKPINTIIDYRTVTITAGQTVNLGPVAVYGWFAQLKGHVFSDPNRDGFPAGGVPVDPGRNIGMPGIAVNLRYSDGSIFQTTTTGADGSFAFEQYFPFWRFLVAEVDTSYGKPTGLTSIVDNGGPLPNNKYGLFGIRPQIQPGGLAYRTEVGPVVTEAVNLYADMTDYLAFGKAPFTGSENGGIRGMINYATTRTEEDPKTSALDGWEPGIPNVEVTLYRAMRCPNSAPGDNCWVPDGDALMTTRSDSWNDNLPTNCVSSPYGSTQNLWPNPEIVNGFTTPSCAETFKNWDQTRPGVFDGAFSFDTMPDGTPLPPGALPRRGHAARRIRSLEVG